MLFQLKSICNFLTVLFFSILLLLPILTINLKQNVISEREDRILTNMPTFFNQRGELIVKKNNIESWLQDNIGHRNTFIDFATTIQYKIFNVLASSTLHKGLDNWLFYTGDYQIEIATNDYPLSKEDLEKIKNTQLKIYESLKELGKEYILVFPPSKASIYPEMVFFSKQKIVTPEDILVQYLQEHTPIKIVQLKESLLEAKKTNQQYFKTDSHWNNEGLFTAYKHILNKMNEWNITTAEPITAKRKLSIWQGDLRDQLAQRNLLSDEEFIKLSFDASAIELYENTALLDLDKLNDYITYSYKNTEEKKSILIYGDSMFGLRINNTLEDINMPILLANHFAETNFIWYVPHSKWNQQLKLSDIQKVNPDIVMFEITERMIYHLTNEHDF